MTNIKTAHTSGFLLFKTIDKKNKMHVFSVSTFTQDLVMYYVDIKALVNKLVRGAPLNEINDLYFSRFVERLISPSKCENKKLVPSNLVRDQVIAMLREEPILEEEMEMIIEAFGEDKDSVGKIVDLLDEETRTRIVENVLQPNPRFHCLIASQGWLTPDEIGVRFQQFTEEEALEWYNQVTKKELEAYSALTPKEQLDRNDPFEKTLNLLKKVPKEFAKDVVLTFIRGNINAWQENTANHQEILAIIGLDDYLRMVLGYEVFNRADLYANKEEVPDAEEQPLPWVDLFEYSLDESRYPYFFTDDQGDAAEAFLREHSEEELFRWYHEGKPDLEERVATFLADRKNYYAKLHAQGVEIPPEFLPASPELVEGTGT